MSDRPLEGPYQSNGGFGDERPTWVTARWFQFFIRPQQTQAVEETCKKKGVKKTKQKTKESEMVNSHRKKKQSQTLIINLLLRRCETMTDASAESEEGYATQDDYAN